MQRIEYTFSMEGNRAINRIQEEHYEEASPSHLAAAFTEQGATLIPSTPYDFEGIKHEKFDMFSPPTIRAIERLAGGSASYISNPIVSDHFTDHNERRLWRLKMRQEYGEEAHQLLESNRLRLNIIMNPLVRASMLQMALEKETQGPYLEALKTSTTGIVDMCEPIEGFNEKYKHMSSGEKIAFVQEFSKRLQAFLLIATA